MKLQGKWKSDGSDDPSRKGNKKATTWNLSQSATDGVTTADTITIDSGSGGPSNFMYELAVPTDRLFFQVLIVKKGNGSVSIGMVTPPRFKTGYGLKAMLYNGNLTNGMSALKTSFGPYPKEGDTVALEFVESEGNIEVIYYVNAECIGTGFQIVKKGTTPFYPCLSTTGDTELQVKILAQAPPTCLMTSENNDSFNGRYTISKALDASGETVFPLPLDHEEEAMAVQLSIRHQHDDIWSFNLKMCNLLSIRKRFASKKSPNEYILKDSSEGAFFVLANEEQPIMSSKAMPPPPIDEMERKIAKCMVKTWHSIELSENGKALTIFDVGNDIVVVCRRYQQNRHPALLSYG